MKRIFIIRHAKSDHGVNYKRDFDRPLNTRGRTDALRMADVLKKDIGTLDHMLVSAARRTTETAEYFINALGLGEEQITYSDDLYLPAVDDIWQELRFLDEDLHHVAVVTHNPAAGLLLHHYRPHTDLPTCSIIELRYDGARWRDLEPDNVHFISHKYPRLYD